ncbi:spliceosome-associated protein [Cavenderia fasciculata]|uniref:Spliceosome-associated protein n=1 Tax=Cavenderia fasciculata TaxID=261658 RepID=F4Q3U9_CACFS|nr:spliceosome-associated protein [Cavenderia fasciculata]EGG17705.1 spliceosome-associated protein [Cavenderia fasciculata]|eukprot:XP_004356189.1 spliceosome-associated protein [Cavenderia fasciculata]
MKVIIEGSENIDSLPYIDAPLTEDELNMVTNMVQEEMKKFNPPNYLEQLGELRTDIDQSKFQFVGEELKRVELGEKIKPLNLTRYKVEAPQASQKTSKEAWEASVDNAKAQYLHQETRRTNLQLLQRHGGQLWESYLDNDIQNIQDQLTCRLKETKEEIERTNVQRKIEQDQIRSRLVGNQQKWYELVSKNKEIDFACLELEKEIDRLQQLKLDQQQQQQQQQQNKINNNNNGDGNDNDSRQ